MARKHGPFQRDLLHHLVSHSHLVKSSKRQRRFDCKVVVLRRRNVTHFDSKVH